MNIIELPISFETFITIKDLVTGETLCEGSNAIHSENMSNALALGLSRGSGNFISEMHFGSGAAIIATDGTITYRKPNVTGLAADLYNPTYYRVVDALDANKAPGSTDNVTISHISGTNYTDIVVKCTLSNYEPPAAGQGIIVDSTRASLDSTTLYDGEFEFNEIGLKTRGENGVNTGRLLTHFVFHPVQKNVDQIIGIEYTLRVRAG